MSDKRTNRTFDVERRDIKFMFWRKRVDSSMFSDRAITIIKPFERWWNIAAQFKHVTSQSDRDAKVKVIFENQSYQGSVTRLNAKKRSGTYRMWYSQELETELERVFVMSYFRSIEGSSARYHDKESKISVYEALPFHEFLDIEYDDEAKTFYLTARYVQQPIFPELFDRIRRLGAPSLGAEKGDGKARIVRSDWHAKGELPAMPDRKNVIYCLRDNNAKEIYVGTAASLKDRLGGPRAEIPGWTHFRYDALPDDLSEYRVEIEKMVISLFEQLFPVRSDSISEHVVSNYRLTNKKIPKRT